MLALIAGFIWAPAGTVLAFPAALPTKLVTGAVAGLARAPFAAVYTSSPAAVIWLVYVYAMLLALWVFRTRIRQYLIPACLAAVTLCLILVGSSVFSAGGLSVTALDVGQGQSVVMTSGRYTAVIDCGSISGKDAGDLLVRHLRSGGRTRIDLLILTHFHTDHADGVLEVLERIPVSALAMPDPSVDGGELPQQIAALAAEKGVRTVFVTENLAATLGDTRLVLYAPAGDTDENERGVVILATRGDFDALVTGTSARRRSGVFSSFRTSRTSSCWSPDITGRNTPHRTSCSTP
jgi:competence protein ComEC